MKDLEGVTRVGVVWIGRRDAESLSQPEDELKNQAERTSQVHAEFLEHAEQVALAWYPDQAPGRPA